MKWSDLRVGDLVVSDSSYNSVCVVLVLEVRKKILVVCYVIPNKVSKEEWRCGEQCITKREGWECVLRDGEEIWLK